MNRLKTAVLGGATVLVGALTLRRIRERRATDPEPPTAAEVAGVEARAATEAGKEALTHAGAAASHGLEAARTPDDSTDGSSIQAKGARRLRRLGKGWARQ